jgi:heavy metal sensor kinase
MIDRLPIRIRLTLPFALVMALLLAATGFLIYHRVGSTLLRNVDQGLRGQVAEAQTRVAHGRAPHDQDSTGEPSLGEVVHRDGSVSGATPTRLHAIVSAADLTAVLGGATIVRSSQIPGLEGDWRILAAPATSQGRRVAVVVASSLEQREETLDRLVREFLLGGSLALILATLLGYGLAAAAFRPVEAMRRRAASIGAETSGARLPIPKSRDEVSRLAETLNEMLARLEAALEHERRFVDDASHELRTPLALLRTELELALRHPRGRAELERALGSAAEEAERLSRLAEDLLLFARSDEGRLPVRRVDLGTRQLLDEVAARFQPRASEDGRSVRVESVGDPRVDADPARIEQALGNLVANALTYGTGPVVLTAGAENGRVELHVTDDGPGVPPEFLPRAFDRFSRADEARAGGGAGLGLAIVDLIARAHDGEAGIANRPGGGTDAWISLPAAR